MQPHILTIEVSKKCNLKCGHCFARNQYEQKPAMSLETAKEIARDGFEFGFTCLHITGGEPTLWKHFLLFLQFCLDLGYEQIYFNTNGMYLNPKLCQALSVYKNQLNISISLDGDETLHNSLRGEGTFPKACLGIQTALEYELSVEIFSIARKSLIPKLPYFTKMVYETFPTIKHLVLIQLVNVENSFQDMSSELLSPEDFIILVKNASLLNLYGYKILFLENPLAYIVSLILGLNLLHYSPNRIRYDHLVILANLKITGNHSSLYDYGTYTKGSLQRIMEDNNYYLLDGERDKACKTCEFLSICREHGLLYPADIRYDKETTSPYCQRVLALLGNKWNLVKLN